MNVITTATVDKFCADCKELTDALNFLSTSNALTPSALAAFQKSAAACLEFYLAYEKYIQE